VPGWFGGITGAHANNLIVTSDHGFVYQHQPIEESDLSSAQSMATRFSSATGASSWGIHQFVSSLPSYQLASTSGGCAIRRSMRVRCDGCVMLTAMMVCPQGVWWSRPRMLVLARVITPPIVKPSRCTS
jgi:hypothetical protein